MDIKDIGIFNKALLAKWKWQLGTEVKGIWREVEVKEIWREILLSRYEPIVGQQNRS